MKKKVLFVTNNMSGGGAEKILQVIVSNLDRSRFDITVCSLHEPSSLEAWPQDVKYYSLYKHRSTNYLNGLILQCWNKIIYTIYNRLPISLFHKLFVHGTYDTEVAFIEGYATRIVSGSGNRNSRKIAWLHIDMFRNHWSSIAFPSDEHEKMAYLKFDKVFGVSESVAESLHSLFMELPCAEVMYNPVNEKEIISKSRQQIDKDIKLPPSGIRLVSVGRLERQKGYDRLIPIIRRLRDAGHDVSLSIIGEGKERAVLEKLIKEHNLCSYVQLLGFKHNPYPYFVESDCFVCSSRSEGFSTVVTEALILGLPVVTTECAGMHELLGDNSEYGIVCDNNADALYDGIVRILDPDVRQAYRKQAVERGASFKLSNLIKNVEECL